jgi:import inner membrane translocase subunit TIM10
VLYLFRCNASPDSPAQLSWIGSIFAPADLFNKIASSCFDKCASRKHKEADLSLGEMTCADRCVSKYLESQERVGAVLQKANEAQLAQQQSLTEMQQRLGG